jgi:hypothetical protein
MRRSPARRFQSAETVLRVLDDYFRRRGEDDLRGRLAELAGGAMSKEEARRPKRRLRWVRLVGLVAVLLAGLGIAGWATGTLQRFVVAETHALAQIEIRLRKGEREIGEHLIRTELLRMEAGELAEVPVTLPMMRPVDALETPDYIALRSRLLTLPAGRYRTTVRVEDTTVRSWLSLHPIAWEGDVQLVAAQWDPVTPEAVDLDVAVFDVTTGIAIDEVTLQTRRDDAWVDLVRSRDGSFRRVRTVGASGVSGTPGEVSPFGSSGTRSSRFRITEPFVVPPGETIRLRVQHPDYLTVEAELETDARSEAAQMRLGMVPRPGRLVVTSRLEGEARLLVNGEAAMRAAGREPAIVDTPPLFAGTTRVEFVPGSYRIAVEADGTSESVSVSFEPGEEVELTVERVDDRPELTRMEE